jgi:hemerythrin-like metal-binding protein
MSIGDADIDADHKKLISLINAAERYIADWDPAMVSEVLKRLKEYCQLHFVREEVLMSRSGYSEYEAHSAMHEEVERKLVMIYDKYHESDRRENQKMGADILLKVLNDYIVNHVLKEDLKFKTYLKSSISRENLAGGGARQIQETLTNFRKTILVVDSIDFVRKQIGQNLRKSGAAEVVEANEGGKAFEMLRTQPELYGLVIADRHTEPTNGLHLLKFLRTDPSTPPEVKNVPFVMLTSDGNKKSLAEINAAGANGIVMKPFALNDLLNVVVRTIRAAG